ncbi:MAG: OmpH family outer membrane protein [Pirellulaceae bacterium]
MPAVCQGQEPSGGSKVALIDIEYVFQNADSIKSEIAGIEQQMVKLRQFGKSEQDKLLREAEIIKTLEPGTAAYLQQEEKVASMESSLKLETFRRRKQLADAEAALYFKNYQRIHRIVAQIAVYNNIDLVLRYDSEAMDLQQPETVLRGVMKNVVYRIDSIDLTHMVLDALSTTHHVAEASAK